MPKETPEEFFGRMPIDRIELPKPKRLNHLVVVDDVRVGIIDGKFFLDIGGSVDGTEKPRLHVDNLEPRDAKVLMVALTAALGATALGGDDW